jgi:hypothetical protein
LDCIGEFAFALGLNGERWLLMLQAYLDDSGTHGGPYCFLAGYMAGSERWAAFAKSWDPICREYLGDRPFKTRAAYRKKDPGFMPEEGRLRLAQCIADHVEIEIWSALPEFHANEIKERYGVEFDRYMTCFAGVIDGVLSSPYVAERKERLAWVFDHHGGTPAGQESKMEYSLLVAFNGMRNSVDSEARRLLHAISFSDDESMCQLQAADFLAWHKRRRHAKGADVADLPEYEILVKNDIPRIEVVWFNHRLEDLLIRIARQNMP